MASLASVVLLATTVLGQADQPSPNYQHLKGLEFLIGDWEVKGATWDDSLGLPKGTKYSVQGSYKWIWNKAGLQWDAQIKFETGATLFGGGIIVCHPGEKVVSVSTTSGGGLSLGEWKENARTKCWTFIEKGTDPEGKTTSSRSHHCPIDKETFAFQLTDRKVGDKKLPDSPKSTFVRKKAK